MLIDHYRNHSLDLAGLRKYLQQARRTAGLRGSCSVCLTGDEEVRKLNVQFRGLDKPTDVLSFPAAGEEDDFPEPEPVAKSGYLGDIVISLETAARQAGQLGHGLDQEVRVLILHGLLHLAGYDHETDQGEMRERENQLREQLGLGSGLIARVERHAAGSRRRTPSRTLR